MKLQENVGVSDGNNCRLSVTLNTLTGQYQLFVYFTFCLKNAGLLANSALLLNLTPKYCHQSLIKKIIILSNHIDL